jgi:hypothetical protein
MYELDVGDVEMSIRTFAKVKAAAAKYDDQLLEEYSQLMDDFAELAMSLDDAKTLKKGDKINMVFIRNNIADCNENVIDVMKVSGVDDRAVYMDGWDFRFEEASEEDNFAGKAVINTGDYYMALIKVE